MKKVIYGLFGFAALSMVSCDYHDPNDGKFGGDNQSGYYVAFQQEGESFIGFDPAVETDFEVSVPVVLGNFFEGFPETSTNTPVNEDGLTVNYTVEDVSGSSDFIVKKGSVYIPKGDLIAYIPFTVPANAQGADCADFVITLDSTSKDKITAGYEGNGVLTHTVHVGPASRDLLVGTYDVAQVSDGIESNYDVTITAGTEPNEFIIRGLYNFDADSETIAYINNTGQISSPADYNDNFLFNAGAQGDVFVANASGVAYCGQIVMDFILKRSGGDIEVSTVMTKQ